MSWLEATIVVEEQRDQIEPMIVQLAPFAINESVIVERLGDPANLDPTAMRPETRLKLYRDPAKDDEPGWRAQIASIAQTFGCGPPTFMLLADEDWQESWKENFRPLEIGTRFLVAPVWEEIAQTERILIQIEPGAAFGTGLHETTQLCLEALERLDVASNTVLDLGAGSGILSIGAAKLGAAKIVAVEIDEDACANMRHNIRLNGVDKTTVFEAICGSLENLHAGQYDLILANIVAAILIPMIEEQRLIERLAPEGESRIIFSGVIKSQESEFSSAIMRNGGAIESVVQKGEWLSFCVKRRSS